MDTIQLTPIVYTLVEIIKMTGVPSRLLPLISVILGTGFGLIVGSWVDGLMAGLMASGLYAGAKATLK